MEVPDRKKLKIDDVDGDYLGQFPVILSGVKAFDKLLAPVKEASLVHVALVTELNFDVDPDSLLMRGDVRRFVFCDKCHKFLYVNAL